MKPVRVALVTPEYVSEYATGGGLGNYLRRLSHALVECGHEAEIFVPSREAPGPLEVDGVFVQRVARAEDGSAMRAWRALHGMLGLRRLRTPPLFLLDAHALAAALARRQAERPFDLVQSADYLASGLFVPKLPGRPHLVRVSGDGDLWARVAGVRTWRRRFETRLERACVARADVAYAPSRYVAERLAQRFGLDVKVLRPPALLDAKPAIDPALRLPPRYLVHFGQLSPAKGSELLARALPRVWAREPDFAMVWAGPDRASRFEGWARSWGEHRCRVTYLGELRKPSLYAAVSGAEAAVLPSLVDNLPNTVIESLLLGVPVVGSKGASIDELVEDGRSGELVPVGDVQGLADALLRVWRGQTELRRGSPFDSAIAEQMRPVVAVGNLLRLAGLAPAG